MRILLTGSTGAIGRLLVPHLVKQGFHLTLVLRDPTYNSFPDLSNIEVVGWDDISIDIDGVVHLAGYTSSSDGFEDRNRLIDSNIKLGCHLLAELERCSSLKFFINFGSSTEYFNNSDLENPTYFYSATKTAFKSFLKYYSIKLNIRSIHVVLHSVYGIQSKKKKIFDYIIDGVNSSVPIKLTEGNQELDFIHVYDVLDFVTAIVQNYQQFSIGGITKQHAGTGQSYSLRTVAKIIEDFYKVKLNVEWGGLPYRNRDNMLSKAKLKDNLINWSPNLSLKDGIMLYLKQLS